jgi:hypothetical protein
VKRIRLTILACAILAAHQGFAQSGQIPIYEDAEAYDVYSAVLSLRPPRLRNKHFRFRENTITSFGTFANTEIADSICIKPEPEYQPIYGPVIADFVRVNKTKWRLQRNFEVVVPYSFISEKTVLSLTDDKHWEEFYKVDGNDDGFIDLSAVGFNADKTIALVSVGRWCGGTCGEGSYYFLQKKDGKWSIANFPRSGCSWIS